MFLRCSIAMLTTALIIAQRGAGALSEPRVAQEPQKRKSAEPQSDAQAKIRATSDLVVLAVTVKDANGNLVPGLQKSDFHVFDDGVEQSLSVFTEESFPLSLVVVVDDDLPPETAEQMTRSLRALAGGIGMADEAMICRFDLSFYPGSSFAHDMDTLWNELREVQDHSGPS